MGDKEGKRKELVRPTSSAQASSSSLSDNPSGVQSNDADPPSLSAQTKTADGADRKRIYRACEICRRKKIRCDGLKPCKACVRMSESCVFLDDSSKTMYSKKYVESLEERIKRMEELLPNSTTPASSSERRRVSSSSAPVSLWW
ncbi:hypothetical protein CF336_g923 [Tilletia laevis]|uniref:Zn(2)-C6 fungal-type domain-containing protein n=1 Tax=Tilletia caries TaxID=13290 RepID=A0A8T8TTD3_9BASI|nr:hypothetical protein CF336_g923 [Tilletia laevis]KAE8204804.1 hypothetical protein CF328_g871 [Tilletia controversa]KAE8264939.1 hypothetical protein A4X03_0g598 [Tilletia caries]